MFLYKRNCHNLNSSFFLNINIIANEDATFQTHSDCLSVIGVVRGLLRASCAPVPSTVRPDLRESWFGIYTVDVSQ